jgi:hypothetical protein
MTDTTHAVWAVATDTLCDGWSAGTITEGDIDYADVYLTKPEAERELADLIRERLTLFIEDPENYGDLATALDSGFEVVEAAVRDDGIVIIDGEEKGTAPPSVKLALAANKSTERNHPC